MLERDAEGLARVAIAHAKYGEEVVEQRHTLVDGQQP
jgi:hypothetical protein